MRPPRRSWALAANSCTTLLALCKAMGAQLVAPAEWAEAERWVSQLATHVDESEECEEP